MQLNIHPPFPDSVHLKKEGDQGVLEVQDEGAGIPKKEHKRIFQKFYRVGNEDTRTAQGTGLGLYLCRKITQDHKMRLQVSGQSSKGNHFYGSFQLITSMTEPVRKSILLVEDEENLHDALRLNLELENYQVTSAYDGNQALKAISDEYFDLVILDVMLPGIDGISVAETIRVRQNPVPILILSARNTSADRVLGLKKGADDYLNKPFNLEELLLRVQKLIEKNERLQERNTIPDKYVFGKNVIDFKAQEAFNKKNERFRLE